MLKSWGCELHGCASSVGIALFCDSIQDLIPLGGKRGSLGHNRLEERKMRIMIPNRRLLRHGDAFAVLIYSSVFDACVEGQKEVKRPVLKVSVLVLVAGMKVWGGGKGKGREWEGKGREGK